MSWLLNILGLFKQMARFFSDKQLIDAGKSQANEEALEDRIDAINEKKKRDARLNDKHLSDIVRRWPPDE